MRRDDDRRPPPRHDPHPNKAPEGVDNKNNDNKPCTDAAAAATTPVAGKIDRGFNPTKGSMPLPPARGGSAQPPPQGARRGEEQPLPLGRRPPPQQRYDDRYRPY